jgi:hypothetical protein
MPARRYLAILGCVVACAVALVWLHCQYIHQCYRLDELRQGAAELRARCDAFDARVSELRQPHALAERMEVMRLSLVSPFDQAPGLDPVRVAQVDATTGR